MIDTMGNGLTDGSGHRRSKVTHMTDQDSAVAPSRRVNAEGYRTIAETVSHLCRSDADLLTERERAIAFDILTMVIDRVEAKVRRVISERVARRPDLPRDLALPLARDEIYVAVPMLLHCPVLSDDDLIAIATSLSTLHRLAIAERPRLGPAVARVLIDIGGTEVVQGLIGNASAEIDHDGFLTLAERARDEAALQEPLVERTDFPPDLAATMLLWVGAGMKRVIAKRYSKEIAESVRPDIDRTLEEVLARLPAAVTATGYARFSRVFGATERDIAVLTRLDVETVRRFLRDGGPRAFTLMCRAAGVTRSYFETLYRDFHGLGEAETVRTAPENQDLAALFDRTGAEQAKDLLVRAITEAHRAAKPPRGDR